MTNIHQHYTFIKILTGSDLSKRRMPAMTLESDKKGPVVWLTGCMHGDEIGGTVIIHEVFKRLKKSLLKGKVHAFPLMNPFGFEAISRNIVLSKEDLNRSFPGNENGTLAERIASKILSLILQTKPDLVIDLHNDWNKSIPYAVLDRSDNERVDQKILEIAGASGMIQIEETDRIHSTLTYNLIRNNVPAFVLELGESFIINEKNIEIGIRSIWNILEHLKMVENTEAPYRYPSLEHLPDHPLQYSALPLSSSSGIVRFLKKPGDLVSKGAKLAKVCNAFGKQVELITALSDGIVLGHTDNALAYPGSPVMAFGLTSKK
ncbi:succinylglutamate desuccinylase/aspartoacylase family protein [Fulvivirga sedimenti]|uniref:Succinylglutamate desuccinylase/aspartoacylase family protein n=1 Tax=Fulvivirga sedimenti TaxID=2879465 RepID=A0A9X1HT57_9BACT|nr:succinylglutamate desuccinylase/aspartoacylase family protein [Fulvivirga sedimenti]MCA6075140.1 succinylglutamate desuccinylase/aspartoacylase family protein [Fulvivirga sedimenti]MCA6076317.1 succinylglutamate desuccinylase/aspartoacylase family protein [Fulvivirga sedimenti]MCA6077445.1 succinylglutamate desuccinylase/aspartoacylase family protein [Fulvivirga sedimenti]